MISDCARRRRPPMAVKGRGRGRVEKWENNNEREGKIEDCLGKVRDITEYICVIWEFKQKGMYVDRTAQRTKQMYMCVCVSVDL